MNNLREELTQLQQLKYKTVKDYKRINDLESKIADLNEEIINSKIKYYALKLTHLKFGFTAYLTDNPEYCLSDIPVWFKDSHKLAELMNNANLNPGDYDVEVIDNGTTL